MSACWLEPSSVKLKRPTSDRSLPLCVVHPFMSSRNLVDASVYRPAMETELWELVPPKIVGPLPGRATPRSEADDDVAQCAAASLRTPCDFPDIQQAIVTGDHVAFAVDPNVPRLAAVLTGLLGAIAHTDIARISIVLWDEVDIRLVHQLNETLRSDPMTARVSQGGLSVVRHRPSDRSQQRYVIADEEALPVYLAQDLVDADMVIPVVAARRARGRNEGIGSDPTGIFPMFADSESMQRHLQSGSGMIQDDSRADAFHPTASASMTDNLLGVQVMVLVSSDAAGEVGSVLSGTPLAIRQQLEAFFDAPDDISDPQADLVLASLDGNIAVQTWPNVARAAIAGSRHVSEGGAIVVWSRLADPCPPSWQRIWTADSTAETSHELDDPALTDSESELNPVMRSLATRLADLRRSYTVWLHSDLPRTDVEDLGWAVVDSVSELKQLASSRNGAGVLRAAALHGAEIE